MEALTDEKMKKFVHKEQQLVRVQNKEAHDDTFYNDNAFELP
jgi:hypothetical protein